MDVLISTASNDPAEAKTAQELHQLLTMHDLTGLTWTDRIAVKTATRPHSHPVLTVNTRRSGDSLLAVYLHEQLHWWLAGHEQTADAIAATHGHWVSTPSRANGGARSDFSTRLHLFVCFLEHRAMQHLVGGERARSEIARQIDEGIYSWVRTEIQDRSELLTSLCNRYALLPARLADPAPQ